MCDFDKNFALLFFTDESFLVLNLATRVQFWIKRTIVENEMKRNVPNFDDDGRPFIFDNNANTYTKIGKMKTGIDKVEIPYQMELNGGGFFLGSFKYGYKTIAVVKKLNI